MRHAETLWIAKTVLRREAAVLCPHCLHNHDPATPLTDPKDYVPREIVISGEHGKNIVVKPAVFPKAHRYCDVCGTISFGRTLADRDFNEFRESLEELCCSAKFADLPESRL